jgi:DNA-binding NarL/FixJ family response regulator
MTSQVESSYVERPITVAAVVPVWLQDALAVLLKSEEDIKLVACTATVQTLLLLALERTPSLVILVADERDEQAAHQVRQIKAVWPASRCLVLVEQNRQRSLMRSAGADEVLLKGVLPQQLLTSIHQTKTT